MTPALLSRTPLALAACAALLASCSSGGGKGPLVGSTNLKGADSYGLPFCAVDGKGITKSTAIRRAYKGREMRFCSEACQKEFEANPGDYIF